MSSPGDCLSSATRRGDWPELKAADASEPRPLLIGQDQSTLLARSGRPLSDKATPPTGLASGSQLNAFRELRTRLQAMAASLQLSTFTTLVVPLTAGCGSSFVARNLAYSFSLEQGSAALLVDCNSHHPSQHVELGADSSDGGLFDHLEGRMASFAGLIRPTGSAGLYLLPAGQPGTSNGEYFTSSAMQDLIAKLRAEPCQVVLDGPPCEGAPDARILAELADIVVVVVGYGRSTGDAIAKATAGFDPKRFAGVVFNERP